MTPQCDRQTGWYSSICWHFVFAVFFLCLLLSAHLLFDPVLTPCLAAQRAILPRLFVWILWGYSSTKSHLLLFLDDDSDDHSCRMITCRNVYMQYSEIWPTKGFKASYFPTCISVGDKLIEHQNETEKVHQAKLPGTAVCGPQHSTLTTRTPFE